MEAAESHEPPKGLLVIPLQRISGARRGVGTGQSFYIGNVSVGYPPQKMRVLFDTGSGHVLLPHKVCKAKACKAHRSYSAVYSHTSVDVDVDGKKISKRTNERRASRDAISVELTLADLGTGEAQAILVRDRVCVVPRNGSRACATTVIAGAINMTDTPFMALPSDGIVGLGLTNLSISPAANFFAQLLKSSELLPQFGMTFGDSGGELHIGGYHPGSIAAPMQWFPVHSPEEGFWQVKVNAIRVGGVTVFSCEKHCHAVIDTAASRLGVQEAYMPTLLRALTSESATVVKVGKCTGPVLEFDLGGMSIKLGPEDYAESDSCAPDIGPLDVQEPNFTGIFTLGEQVLRQYFVAFDWAEKRLGFAPAAGAASAVKPTLLETITV